jgi:sugar fermentation stimulation protein A
LFENDGQKCYVEVKNVTLMEQQGQGLFPDAVSERGTRHLRELIQMRSEGHRALLLFCVQHSGIRWVEPAATIDPEYAQTMRQAVAAGVEVIAYSADMNMKAGTIVISNSLPFKIN